MIPTVPTAISAAAAAWDVELLEPAHSRYSVTWFARQADRHVVLKAGDVEARRREALALTAYAPTEAAVQLLDRRDGVLLLQRALPGDDLHPTAAGDDDAAMVVIGSLIPRLQSAGMVAAAGLPPLSELQQTFDRYRADGRDVLPAAIVDRAEAMLAELTTGSDVVVLHGDLHHANVLRADWDRPDWLAIDPHGWFGDPVFDVASPLLNPGPLLATTDDPGGLTRRRAAILAEVTGFDLARILAWAFTGAVISELWCWEDHAFVAGGPLRLAQALI